MNFLPVLIPTLLLLLAVPVPAETTLTPAEITEKCQECHGEENLFGGGDDGSLHELTVEKEVFDASVHGKKFECTDCHFNAGWRTHPASGFDNPECAWCHTRGQPTAPSEIKDMLAAKRIAVPDSFLVAGDIAGSDHELEEDGASCEDCHTGHYVYASNDIRATTHPENVVITCGACHEDLISGENVLSKTMFYSVAAHRKEDLTGPYTYRNCTGCHRATLKHGLYPPEAVNYRCAECHAFPSEQTYMESKTGALRRPFHTASMAGPVKVWSALLNIFGGLTFLTVAGALVITAVLKSDPEFTGFLKTLYPKNKK